MSEPSSTSSTSFLPGIPTTDWRRLRVQWTGDVIGLMGVVIIVSALLIGAATLLGAFSFMDTLPIYILVAVILPAWLAVKRGRWAWAGYLPVAMCFSLGVYSSWEAGFITIFALFYALAVWLAGMLIHSRASFGMVAVSAAAYTILGLRVDGFSADALSYVITFTAALTGVALLERYTYLRLERILAAQVAINDSLKQEIRRREQAEERLLEQGAQLRRLAENTTDLVAEIDPNGVLRYASPSYQASLGYDLQALLGTNAFNLAHPDDLPLIKAEAERVAASRRPGRVTMRARHVDGHYIFVEISGTPLYDEEDNLTGFVIASRDITRQKEIESKLLESEQKFRNIIEALPLGIHMYTLGEDGSLIFSGFNPAADRILNIHHAAHLGKPILEAFPSLKDTGIPDRYLEIALHGGVWDDNHVDYADGQVQGAYEVHAFQTSPGMMVALFADVTERIRAAEALRFSEEKFSTAFVTSPDSVNINRMADGVYIDINQGFTRIMGYEREDVIGKSSLELNIWQNPEDRARLVKGLQETGEVSNLEARFVRKNGDIAIGLMSAKVIVINGEKCILSITREITERIRAEIELREAHALLEQAYEATLRGWARALELRERETADHSRRVVEQTVELAARLGIEGDDLANIRRGALLHDIGKMGVPDEILLKPGRLSPDEWVTMRQHAEFGRALLEDIDYLRASIAIPFSHHEKWDGSGYPEGLRGEQIPLPARIFAVVDVFDALTHYRPYKPAWSAAEAKKYLIDQKGTHFDPRIVDEFLKMLGE